MESNGDEGKRKLKLVKREKVKGKIPKAQLENKFEEYHK